ncbi:MAG: hypothetical protein R3A52_06465 [Polyangiales bacterium]
MIAAHRRALVTVLAVGFAAQCVCAVTMGGALHADEIHQWAEPAWRMLHGSGHVTYEWRLGMRNVAGPGLVAAMFALADALGMGVAGRAGAVWAMTGALSLVGVAALMECALRWTRDRRAAWVTGLALVFSAPFMDLSFRTLGETFSTVTLALALLSWARRPSDPAPAGFWMGLGFVFRYPAGLYLVAPLALLAWRRDRRGLARFALGAAIPVMGLGALDHFTWGSPWASVRAYVDFNLARGGSLTFGTRPWWFYLGCVMTLAPWPVYAAALRGGRRTSLPAFIAITYLVAMSALPHKEWRFFVPALAPLALAAAVAGAPWSGRRARVALALTLVQSFVIVEVMVDDDLHRRDLGLAARVASQRPECRSLLVMDGGHPGVTRLARDLPVRFDSAWRFDRALAALDHRWPREPGRCAVCDRERTPTCVPALTRRGFAPVVRVGRAVVLREGPPL